MKNRKFDNKQFRRRSFILFVLNLVLFFIIFARLIYMQLFSHEYFIKQAEKNRTRLRIKLPERGNFFDRNNVALTNNNSSYRIIVDRLINNNIEETIQVISYVLDFNDEQLDNIHEDIKRQKFSEQITLFDDLSWEQIVRLEVSNINMLGVYIDSYKHRHYLHNNIFCHLIGYIGYDNKINISEFANFKSGITGLEKQFNSKLNGKVGYNKIIVNSRGKLIKHIDNQLSQKGDDIKLTIDCNLQQYSNELLANTAGGSIITLDCQTGEVLSLNSFPLYNQNIMSNFISQKYWQNLTNNEQFPLINKAITRNFAPGSTFKIVMALAALEQGISPNQNYYCGGNMLIANHKYHCWKRTGHANINMMQAIQFSCNCYFYHIASQLNTEIVYSVSTRLGLGKKTNIELPSESAGLMPNPEWKLLKTDKKWNIGDDINLSIGHGYLLTTPLQLALMTARIASGKMISPYLANFDDLTIRPMDFNENHLKIIRQSMFNVVNKPGGNLFHRRFVINQHQYAAKTGTSQVIKIKRDQHGKAMDNQSLKTSHHGVAIGFAPYNEPRFASCVFIEHGKSGSSSAAPILSKLMEFCLKNI